MATELRKFQEAYASITVAVYEPLTLLKWVSGWTLGTMASAVAWRAQKAAKINLGQLPTAQALTAVRSRMPLPAAGVVGKLSDRVMPVAARATDIVGSELETGSVRKVTLQGYPDAVEVAGRIYPDGILNTAHRPTSPQSRPWLARVASFLVGGSSSSGNPTLGARTVPTITNPGLGKADAGFDFRANRSAIFDALMEASRTAVLEGAELAPKIRTAMRDLGLYEFFPSGHLEEALAPIGVAHLYRQLYFNASEGFGPIEEAFTIAPLETLEIVYELVRRQIHEEFLEFGSEVISETATETKNLEEVSDKVSSMIQRDNSFAFSANASGSIGVWSAGASASGDFKTSSNRSREDASRRLKEVTTRASERITKTFSIKTRDIQDITATNLTRRLIKNELAHPVSYGLRRVLRRVKVKVQDLGPRLIWQLYIREPGEGLARSKFVHFREAEPLAPPDIPPGCPPPPKGGTDTDTTSTGIQGGGFGPFFVTLVIKAPPGRVITAVSIDTITDLEGGGKDDHAPVPLNDVQAVPAGKDKFWDETTNTFSVNVNVVPGDSLSVSVGYTYVWEPHPDVIAEWETARARLVAELTEKAAIEKFEREKALITERSKIRTRPPADLRREERYEVMNRMVSHLFARSDDPSSPAPLEMEYFHKYFDIEAMFTYTHPSWWKPRYSIVATGLAREPYEITAESEPARMGSSLGWKIQADGDTRRNEFINSPWVRVCLPIRPGRERDAIDWLAKHVEGEVGYDPAADPLKELLEDIESRREEELALGTDGADYVTIDSTVGDEGGEPEEIPTPEDVFPIVHEFEVTVPTDGFVYDELQLVGP